MFLEFLYTVEEGTPGKHVPEGLFDKAYVLIFASQKRVHSIFVKFLYIVVEGRLLKVLLRDYSTK